MNKLTYELVQGLREISIEFKIELQSDGFWAAESMNLDGIITGGNKHQSINEMIKDAVFTYFEIPPHLCSDTLIRCEGFSKPKQWGFSDEQIFKALR